MKVKVNRALSGGQYRVNFELSDFSPEEVAKMTSFGVPTIQIIGTRNNVPAHLQMPINQINKGYEATFPDEDAAKKYESTVLSQLRAALERLRTSKDTFSSTDEVEM